MNLTNDLHDYINVLNQTFNIQEFKFKIEKYGYIDKCTQINQNLNDVSNQLKNLIQTSKTSSLFNETHLKFNRISKDIQDSIKFIEKTILTLENEDTKKYIRNKFEKKIIDNSIDLLKDKLSEIGASYQKFLKTQGDLIRQIEKRKANLVNTKRPKTKRNNLLKRSII